MAKIKFSHGEWTKLVNTAKAQATAVPTISGTSTGSTNLQRFKKFEDIQNKVNSVVKATQEVASNDTAKMLSVGQNVVDFDGKAAANIAKNATHIKGRG
ncbi:hypothetical protein WOSG25_012570 [Weissella oryzae SG25]|uniref:Uncharacterized protein n=1 Tax=Weissella oryzae (strain DSM 25784 / JCM 18191 / LMG 30913 / SG25) TaxID=1329250 RepID=A0A069CR09_WEIOS|nr:hypothetical protein [Weissella oryzae]GAK30160.1 hypothetical protein WOSG25_012570 [Weissella oryzae SG25]